MIEKRKLGLFVLLISVIFYIFSFISIGRVNAHSKNDLMAGSLVPQTQGTTFASDAIYQRYIDNGVFPGCSAGTKVEDCAAAIKAKEETKNYANYIESSLRRYDVDSTRLNSAMETFNEHANTIYSFLAGFGCLSSLIIFIIIFVRITWLPDNTALRRRAMEDILTSGIATTLLGCVWLVVSVFQSSFSRMWESNIVYTKDWTTAANVFLYEYKNIIVGISGIATLTTLIMTIRAIMIIVTSAGNPGARAGAMKQALLCGLATAGLGSLTVITGFFWNAIS